MSATMIARPPITPKTTPSITAGERVSWELVSMVLLLVPLGFPTLMVSVLGAVVDDLDVCVDDDDDDDSGFSVGAASEVSKGCPKVAMADVVVTKLASHVDQLCLSLHVNEV